MTRDELDYLKQEAESDFPEQDGDLAYEEWREMVANENAAMAAYEAWLDSRIEFTVQDDGTEKPF